MKSNAWKRYFKVKSGFPTVMHWEKNDFNYLSAVFYGSGAILREYITPFS